MEEKGNLEPIMFKKGDEVALITNRYAPLIFVAYLNDNNAKCLNKSAKTVTVPVKSLIKYQPPTFFGGVY